MTQFSNRQGPRGSSLANRQQILFTDGETAVEMIYRLHVGELKLELSYYWVTSRGSNSNETQCI